MRSTGTVFHHRKAELLALALRCDDLAQRARARFDSARVGYALSDWLFRVRSFGLIQPGERALSRRRRFWRHLRDLFVAVHAGTRVGGEGSG